MAHQCSKCGKGPQMGNSVTHRGKAKYLGGVGTKITGITRRQFKPNLQRIRVTENGSAAVPWPKRFRALRFVCRPKRSQRSSRPIGCVPRATIFC